MHLAPYMGQREERKNLEISFVSFLSWKSLRQNAHTHTHTHRILEGSVTQDSLSWRIVKYAGVFFNHLPIARMPHIHTVICCTSSPNEPKTCFIIIYSPFSWRIVVAAAVAIEVCFVLVMLLFFV